MKMGEHHLFSDLESGTKRMGLPEKENRKARILLGIFSMCVIILVAAVLVCGAGEAAAAQRCDLFEHLAHCENLAHCDLFKHLRKSWPSSLSWPSFSCCSEVCPAIFDENEFQIEEEEGRSKRSSPQKVTRGEVQPAHGKIPLEKNVNGGEEDLETNCGNLVPQDQEASWSASKVTVEEEAQTNQVNTTQVPESAQHSISPDAAQGRSTGEEAAKTNRENVFAQEEVKQDSEVFQQVHSPDPGFVNEKRDLNKVAAVLVCETGEAAQRCAPAAGGDHQQQEANHDIGHDVQTKIEVAVYLLSNCTYDARSLTWNASAVDWTLRRMGEEWVERKGKGCEYWVESLVEKAARANRKNQEEATLEESKSFLLYKVPKDLNNALDKLFGFQGSDELENSTELHQEFYHQQIAGKLNKLKTKNEKDFYNLPPHIIEEGGYYNLEKAVQLAENDLSRLRVFTRDHAVPVQEHYKFVEDSNLAVMSKEYAFYSTFYAHQGRSCPSAGGHGDGFVRRFLKRFLK